jgi:arsenite methyltransferase
MTDNSNKSTDLKKLVRDSYGRIAQENGGAASCCTPMGKIDSHAQGRLIGYSPDQLASLSGVANLGLGCGNPIDRAGLQPGETVLDLGSGPGFDAFLAAGKIGPEGFVIGVDMTPEMVAKARENASKHEAANVEFRLGDIERLPVESDSVDVVVSNCVINLSPDKETVYRDVFRVLKPGGRICISDVLLQRDVPEEIKNDPAAWCG